MKNISRIGMIVLVILLMVWAGIYMFFYQKQVLGVSVVGVEKVTVTDNWVTVQGVILSSAERFRSMEMEQSKGTVTLILYGSLAGSTYEPKEPFEADDAFYNVLIHEKGDFRHVAKVYIKDEQGKHLIWSKTPIEKKK